MSHITLPDLGIWFGPPRESDRPDPNRGGTRQAYPGAPSETDAESPKLSAEDADIVARLGSDDEAVASHALESLHVAWAASLARYVDRIVHSPDVADDIVQEVFVAIWNRRTTVLSSGSVRAYLYGSVHRRALQTLRNARVAHQWADRVAFEISFSKSTADTTDSACNTDELANVLRAAIEQLPRRQRETFLLYRERDLSLAEVAHIMGTSVNTVKVQLHRAGTTLRAAVEAYLN